MKYGSDGLDGCVLAAVLLAVSLTSPLELAREMLMELLMETFLLELATERSCDELPTYKSPYQQDPPYEMKSDRPKWCLQVNVVSERAAIISCHLLFICDLLHAEILIESGLALHRRKGFLFPT